MTSEAEERPMDAGEREGERQHRRFRWPVRLLGFSLLIYAGVATFFFAIQAKMIFPGAATQGSPWAEVQPPPRSELVNLTTGSGQRVVALFGQALAKDGSPPADVSSAPTLLYFYGNGMSLADCLDQFEEFRRLGLNVLIPDYVGYGMSGGQAGEPGCRETAEASLAYLRSRSDLDQGRIVVAGWSLGGGVAMDLASRHEFSGVAVFCTFTSMVEMARRLVPFLPVSLLIRHRFDNLAKVGQINSPILIGHGRRDQLIPLAMADRLAEAARGPVTRLTIDEADHGDFFEVGGERVMTSLGQFIAGLPRRP